MNLLRSAALLSFCCALLGAADSGGKLTVYMAGKPIANETYSFQNAGGKVELAGSGSAHIGPMVATIEEYKIVTDQNYQPLEAVFRGKLGQVNMQVKTVFADGKAKSEITNAQGTQNKEDDVSPGTLVVSQNFPLFPLSILAKRMSFANGDPQTFHAYVLGQTELPVTAQYLGKETVEFATQKVELNHITATATTQNGQTLTAELWVPDDRTIVKLSVPQNKVEAYQEGYEPKPAPPAAKVEEPAPKAEQPPKTEQQPPKAKEDEQKP
jgi:hypothetical protein